jgi:hypothetical protein
LEGERAREPKTRNASRQNLRRNTFNKLAHGVNYIKLISTSSRRQAIRTGILEHPIPAETIMLLSFPECSKSP